MKDIIKDKTGIALPGVSVQRIAGNFVFACLIVLDWTDIYSAAHAIFNSSFATQPMLIIGQLASLVGWSISYADFASLALATSVSLTIFIQGKDLILRLVHREKPWFQWAMFILSAVISLAGNAASFYQDMFGYPMPYISQTVLTCLVLGFFISYGLFSVVSSESFAVMIAMKKRQEVKVTVSRVVPVENKGEAKVKEDKQEPVVKKSRKDMTPEERSAVYSRKDRKPRQPNNVTALVPVTVAEVKQGEVVENGVGL